MHQKHSNIKKAKFGNFARKEVAILGTPCSEIKLMFEQIINNFPQNKFCIVEADHKAEEVIEPYQKYTDKINFQRIDSQSHDNKFEMRAHFENVDLALVNGNHFEASSQIIVLDSRKSLEKKLNKLSNVILIIKNDIELPEYLTTQFGVCLPPIIDLKNINSLFKTIESQFLSVKPPLFGLVLAGGKSTRMGTDKAEIKYRGSQSQKEYCCQLLQNYCGENVFLSLNASQIAENKLPYIQDAFLGIGPMGGILSAFQQYPDVAWLTVACDLPFLSEISLNQLVAGRNSSKIATAFKSPMDEFPEPLITIWEPKAFPKLMKMLAYGYDCPRKTLINSDIELIENKEVKELQNVNTVQEFEKAIIDLSPKIA